MYSEQDIENAVASGVLTPEAAAALRGHVEAERATPAADEENFRLVTGFNDIFVAIAGILVLVGAGWVGVAFGSWGGGAAVAATSWALAEYFTRVRRMALPSIVFFLTFVGGLYFAATTFYPNNSGGGLFGNLLTMGMAGSFATLPGETAHVARSILVTQVVAAAILVGACWLHWQRFRVPVTVAVGVAAIARLVFSLITVAAYPNLGQWLLFVILGTGLAIFAYAMHWDGQDRERRTRRSDVAFWLHLAASPLIVHPIFVLMGLNLGVTSGSGATLAAVAAILIYFALAFVALAVDRRAILVSALVYVLVAAIYLASQLGATNFGFPVAIIVIGSGLLMLSAAWQWMRGFVVPLLPLSWRERVPPVRFAAAR